MRKRVDLISLWRFRGFGGMKGRERQRAKKSLVSFSNIISRANFRQAGPILQIDSPLPDGCSNGWKQIVPFYTIGVNPFPSHWQAQVSQGLIRKQWPSNLNTDKLYMNTKRSSGKLFHFALVLAWYQGKRYDATNMHIRAVHVHIQL